MSKLPEDQRNLFAVTGEFYDNNIVGRWKEEWLAGDDIWVLAFTDDIPYAQNYRPVLLARSIHVMADYYREKGVKNIKFGLVQNRRAELLKETVSCLFHQLIVFRGGVGYRDKPMQDNYE
jgi:hypothetical protein